TGASPVSGDPEFSSHESRAIMPAGETSSPSLLSGRRSWPRVVVRGCVAGFVGAVLVQLGSIADGNVHEVVPGRIYRCSQPSASALEQLIDSRGIRTVVNLRGCCAPNAWYLDECRTTLRRDVSQEDLCFSAGRLPAVHEVRRLVEVIDK